MQVFVEQGYAGTSIRTVAAAVNISVGCLYLHFKSKEDLYLAIIKESLDQFTRQTEEALKDMENPREMLATVISMTIDYTRTRRDLILLQGRDLGFDFGREIKRGFLEARRRLLEGIVLRGIERGVFRRCDERDAARVVMNLLRGIVMSTFVDVESIPSPDACADFVLNGLLKRD